MQERRKRERAFAERLAPVSRSWRQLADDALSSLGISNSSGWALVHLLRLGKTVRQSELARVVGVTEPSLVRTLNLLEGAGLAVRIADETDRRAKHLSLTAEGEALAERIDARLNTLRAGLLGGITDADLETTVAVLDRIAARVAESSSKP
ncbi:MarR family winged helix-turn-helix transcriptional regulator [Novosphingobium clariflavum]|uniref:MarR family winged helix-turn-helix transcriptional regulator n=1 Tax=Novosphingobium clariflavum TaxID=2029884 RepID=A0ABV6S4U8_9SPHN|nr:MarR family transcriptional regulator [Novosphingobium clariflavum]